MNITTKSVLVSLVSVSSFALIFSAHAESEVIKPFAPFQWEMSLEETIHAAQQMEGVKTVALVAEIRGETVLPAHASKRDIMRALTQRVFDANRGSFNGGVSHSYTINGITKKSPSEITVKISPIVIAGIPMDGYATLKAYPGFEVMYPSKVLNDATGSIHYPVALEKFKLEGFSDALHLDSKRIEIANIFCQKYMKKFNLAQGYYFSDNEEDRCQKSLGRELVGYVDMDFYDGDGNNIQLGKRHVIVNIQEYSQGGKGAPITILYTNGSIEPYYADVYQKSRAYDQEMSTQGMKNQSGNL